MACKWWRLGGVLCLLVSAFPLGAHAMVGGDYDVGAGCSPPAGQRQDKMEPFVDPNHSGVGVTFSAAGSCGMVQPQALGVVSYSFDDSQHTFSGTASSTLFASAGLTALTIWNATLQPPAGSGSGAGTKVPVGAASSYTLEIDGIQGPNAQVMAGSAQLWLFLDDQNGKSVDFGSVSLPMNQNGMASGLLQTQLGNQEVPCCTVDLIERGIIGVANGANAQFSDPPSLILPPGWTYTLSADESLSDYQKALASIPEPSTALLLSAGLVGIALRHRRTNKRC